MPRRKPKQDELRLNLMMMDRLMKKYQAIGVYALPGEGKSFLIRKLMEKYRNTEWNFYDQMNSEPEEPFVWAFINENVPELCPDFDVIYCLQYSTDYKESITGMILPGPWNPMQDYHKAAEYRRMGNLDIKAKYVKNLTELKKLLNQ